MKVNKKETLGMYKVLYRRFDGTIVLVKILEKEEDAKLWVNTMAYDDFDAYYELA